MYRVNEAAKHADAEHAAHYLKLSRDDGYKDFASAQKDPAFAKVIKDPRDGQAKIRQIEALLDRAPYGMNSGWSSWEDGMSDRAREVK